MTKHEMSAAELKTVEKRLENEVTPAAVELDEASREQILKRAVANGWPMEQAIWIDRLAKQPLFQAVADGVPGPEALDKAYQHALLELATYYFDAAIDQGKSRMAAFLTIVAMAKSLAERRGETLDYPDAVLMPACEGVEEAARQGLPSKDQIVTGYAIIRKLTERLSPLLH
jgi:hypothetical protein